MFETESFMAAWKEGSTRQEFVWGGNIGLMYLQGIWHPTCITKQDLTCRLKRVYKVNQMAGKLLCFLMLKMTSWSML